MKPLPLLPLLLAVVPLLMFNLYAAEDRLVLEGASGPGSGKHIVLISGDEEYRSEECLPMLARILAGRHGFKCTVLFAINPTTGTISPEITTNIPGLAALASADLMVIFTRFRELPDDQMRFIVNHVDSGRPIIGLRTATHAFAYQADNKSRFRHYDWRNKGWPGGFGQQVLGETWIAHHGQHGKQSTRGVINPDYRTHPILRDVQNIWGPTDVYSVKHLNPEARVLMYGEVLKGMKPGDPPMEGGQNDPMMPLIWLREYTAPSGNTSTVLCSTMGSGPDFENEGLRRLFVNACYNLAGLEVPEKADVRYATEYAPNFFGFGKFKPGLKPGDLGGN